MDKRLADTIAKAGKRTVPFGTGDGTQLLLLPHGARVLGLFAPDSEANFYWVNRDLYEVEQARALFAFDGWQNTGGDRTWVTPELDIFFPDFPDTARHWEPPQLDASDYDLCETADTVGMTRRMTLAFARCGRQIELEVGKWFGPASNPLRHEADPAEMLTSVAYAGYTQKTQLALTGAAVRDPVPAGLWNLIQLPHGGDLLVPTYGRTPPRVLFGDIPDGHLVCEPGSLRFRMTLDGEQKIAVRAAATTGRVGYVWRSGEDWSLVVRNFFVNPSGEYVDVPKDDPDDFGYAVHAVNVNSALGDFCELEYHAPAIGTNADHTRGEDISQVWAFRGGRDAIDTIAQRLLGMNAV